MELALIKLCYLQQAIELVSDTNGTVSKKKVVESAKPVAFRQIAPLEAKNAKSEVKSQKSEAEARKMEAKLMIDDQLINKSKVAEEKPVYNLK